MTRGYIVRVVIGGLIIFKVKTIYVLTTWVADDIPARYDK